MSKKQTQYIFKCKQCGVEHITTNKYGKFCSVKCSFDFKYKERIKLWKDGVSNGVRGKTATSTWIKRYLIEKYGNKCMECGWNKTNIFTGNIPIELEHIDGDFTNNKEDNLKLLCPNCHSLTKTYKGANIGKGRPRNI